MPTDNDGHSHMQTYLSPGRRAVVNFTISYMHVSGPSACTTISTFWIFQITFSLVMIN